MPIQGGSGQIGVYNATINTLTTGQSSALAVDVNQNLLHNGAVFTYLGINTSATTVVKNGSGFLHTITIAGGTAGAITVYDNTAGSGTTIIPTFTPGAVSVPVTLTLDVTFATGLTIVTSAATVITVSYK